MIAASTVALIIAKISIIAIGMLCNLVALSVYYYSRKVHYRQYESPGGVYVINLTITGYHRSHILPLFLPHSSFTTLIHV